MFNALKDALFEVYASKLLTEAAKMTTNSNSTSHHSDFSQYVGPYKLEKTLGKGQTGKARVVDLLRNFYTSCTPPRYPLLMFCC